MAKKSHNCNPSKVGRLCRKCGRNFPRAPYARDCQTCHDARALPPESAICARCGLARTPGRRYRYCFHCSHVVSKRSWAQIGDVWQSPGSVPRLYRVEDRITVENHREYAWELHKIGYLNQYPLGGDDARVFVSTRQLKLRDWKLVQRSGRWTEDAPTWITT
jgi:hypothetical protein